MVSLSKGIPVVYYMHASASKIMGAYKSDSTMIHDYDPISMQINPLKLVSVIPYDFV